MSKLIDAEALEKDGWMMHRTVQVDINTMEYQTKKPTDFHTIEPKRKTGKWIGYLEPGNENYHCSACGTAWYPEDLYLGGNDFPKYCPECGAAMKNWQTEYSMEEQE